MEALLIMIRNPVLGKVKTRLAAGVGEEEALRIYHILLARTRVAALGVSAQKFLFYSDYVENNDLWFNRLFDKHLQQGEDLGARMENAFATAFAQRVSKALIIGSDCPDLNSDLLHRAYRALDRHPFVVGPVEDGGYYLLGMKRPELALFRDIAWSTDTVLNTTLEKIKSLGKSYVMLPTLLDIDTAADWEKWQLQNRKK
jgi:rSAM/selenodomain-associated transferase 1